MRVLHLTIYREFFDKIASGKKKNEYREYKDFWIKKLLKKPGGKPKIFDEVHFRNGYRDDNPFMRVKFLKTKFGKWPSGEKKNKRCFDIYLGKVLDIRNWNGANL